VGVALVAGLIASATAHAAIDEATGRFHYTDSTYPDDTLGQIALYLLKLRAREGRAYVSPEVEEGIVGYQVRFSDDGNDLVDETDWISVRRYTIPAAPDTTRPAEYWKHEYIEFVDRGLNGMDAADHYFLNGRRFDLSGQPPARLREFQSQVETAISAFIGKIDFTSIIKDLGSQKQTAIRKADAFEDGSLPSPMVFGLDLPYVFRPIERDGRTLPENEMLEEVRNRIGWVYSATVGYTDLSGYQMRDLAEQSPLLQRVYDPIEKPILILVMDALFDLDGDGIVDGQNLLNGTTRFREIHEQLVSGARGGNRRLVLPSDKLAALRQEYERVRKSPYKL
jgi:hypothetical protein